MSPSDQTPESARAARAKPDGNSDAEFLGYAAGAKFPAGAGPFTEVYGEGPALIARNGSTLPMCCLLCGQGAAEAPVRLTFTWDSSFQRTKVSTLELRQKAHVFAYLCPAHRQIWRRARRMGAVGTALGGAVMLVGLTLGVWSESSDVPAYTPLGITLTIIGFAIVTAALFYFTLRSRTVSCARIHEGYLYLEGAANSLLAGLTPLPHALRPPAAPAAG